MLYGPHRIFSIKSLNLGFLYNNFVSHRERFVENRLTRAWKITHGLVVAIGLQRAIKYIHSCRIVHILS